MTLSLTNIWWRKNNNSFHWTEHNNVSDSKNSHKINAEKKQTYQYSKDIKRPENVLHIWI